MGGEENRRIMGSKRLFMQSWLCIAWLPAKGLRDVSRGQVENKKEFDHSPFLPLDFGVKS